MNPGKSILVIDDEPNVCAYLKDLLEYFGYEVTSAYTCREAINLLKKRTYDCLLLDFSLNNEPGDIVLRWLRSVGRADPVIMMCSTPRYELRIDLIFKGAADLLGKPIQPTQLNTVLQKVMNQKAPRWLPLKQPGDQPQSMARISSW